LWAASIESRGWRRCALTLTESLEPVDHRTSQGEVDCEELELREGPPYGESKLLWTGRQPSDVLTTETVRRELEASFGADRAPEPRRACPREDGRLLLERQWASAATSTSGRGGVLRSRRAKPAVKHRRAQRREDAKTVGPDPEAPVGKAALGRTRRQSVKGGDPVARRRATLIALEKKLQDASRRQVNKRKDSAVGLFLSNLVSVPLLTRAEEVALAHLIRVGQKLESKRVELAEQLGREPTNQELASSSGARLEDTERIPDERKRAKNMLVQYNLRMVVSIAQRYIGKGQDLEDLLLEGLTGLEHAAERFDLKRGYKFSTYAYYWIRQAVARCISNQSRIIRLPVHVCEALTKITRVTQELKAKGSASDAEIAAALGLTEEKVKMYKKAAMPSRSLDAPAYVSTDKTMENDTMLLVDSIPNEEGPNDEALKDNMVKENLNILLNTLHPRERNVLRMRYGLHRPGGASMKLWDISSAYGLSPERIRQIEEKALRKLRRPWRKSLLTMP